MQNKHKASAAQRTVIAQAITHYATNCLTKAQHNVEFAAMHVQDATYNLQQLQLFLQHNNLKTLVNALTKQDTYAREFVFAEIVNACAASSNASVQKFTYNFVNSI